MEFEAGTGKVALAAVKITMNALPELSPAEMSIFPDVFPWHIRNLAAGLTVTAMPPCLITPTGLQYSESAGHHGNWYAEHR